MNRLGYRHPGLFCVYGLHPRRHENRMVHREQAGTAAMAMFSSRRLFR